jgi:hypothetical protein
MDPQDRGWSGSEPEPSTSEQSPPAGEVVPPSGGSGTPGLSSPPDSSFGTAPGPSSRRPRRLLAALLAALLVVVGGGSATAFFLMRGASEELLQLVPASSEVVVTAYLDPSAAQKVNLMALASRFPALRGGQRLRQQVDDTLDAALASTGLTHEDVRPWLGSQIAMVVDLEASDEAPTVSVLVASKDDEAALAALEEGLRASLGSGRTSEYRGVTMHVFGDGPELVAYAIVDHVVVLSNRSIGLTRVIDVSEGTTKAIADDTTFLETMSSLPEGKLGLAYVNPREIVNQAFSGGLGAAAGTTPGLDMLLAARGIGATLSAHPDGLAFDVAVRLDPSKLGPATRAQLDQPVHENGMVGFVPADAYVLMAQQGFDESLRQAVDRLLATPEGERIRRRLGVDDALSALTGDLAFEIGSGSGLAPAGGAILIGVTDTTAIERTLDGLADLALAAERPVDPVAPALVDQSTRTSELTLIDVPRPTWRTSRYHGTTIRYLDDPSLSGTGLLPAYAVVDGAAIIGSSPGEIRRVLDTRAGSQPSITASSAYRNALARVPDGGSTLYVDVAAIMSRFGSQLPPDVASNVAPFKTLVQGTSNSSSLMTYRLFIEIR